MNEDIDDVFRQAAADRGSVDPALLERISRNIASSLYPVRPLPPFWLLVSALALACAAIATGGAILLGLQGIRNMGAAPARLIFPAVGVLILAAAATNVREMIPGSRHILPAWFPMTVGSIALVAVFALSFHDYRTEHFVSQGVRCLVAGLLQAIPMAIAGRLILRRGFAVKPLAAMLALGTLAGLAGVSMLELHCANFEAPHAMIWHTAVVPLSALACVLFVLVRGVNR